MSKNNIGFIGFGRMGTALVQGALRSGTLKKNNVVVYDHNAKTPAKLKKMGLRKASSAAEVVRKTGFVWLCVKPQKMQAVLDEIRANMASTVLREKCFVSIAAGLPIARFEKSLGHAAVLRVMPNTPALLGAGMSGVARGRKASATHEAAVKKILSSVGSVASVPERLMDAVTAISGSGPAYVFYLAEAMMDAAVAVGFTKETARRLVHQTVYGAGRMLNERPESADELRRQVTSPGGTTAAAVSVFDREGFKKIVRRAVLKAVSRSKELSKA